MDFQEEHENTSGAAAGRRPKAFSPRFGCGDSTAVLQLLSSSRVLEDCPTESRASRPPATSHLTPQALPGARPAEPWDPSPHTAPGWSPATGHQLSQGGAGSGTGKLWLRVSCPGTKRTHAVTVVRWPHRGHVQAAVKVRGVIEGTLGRRQGGCSPRSPGGELQRQGRT